MSKCEKCGYNDNGTGDSAHVCAPLKIMTPTNTPDALRLAKYLELGEPTIQEKAAAAELRRLHAEVEKLRQAQGGEAVAWMHWLYGPVRLFLNKDEAMMELDRLNREYQVDAGSRKMRPLVFGDTSPPLQADAGCTRSHPHENMNSYCKLRTEIARLTNRNAHLEAAQADACKVPQEDNGFLAGCEIEPRPLRFPLRDYHKAMTEGPLHYTWEDKPHRLVYDLIAAVKYYANNQAEQTQKPRNVPQEVLNALDRMCTPLHESRLSGATAEADARCMKLIRDYVLSAAPTQVETHGWRPIETAPKQERVLLFSPAHRLSDNPDQKHDMRVSRASDFTWATHWMPLPAAPSQGDET